MKTEKVNCIVMCCGYANRVYPSMLVFDTFFYGQKDFSSHEALITFAKECV